jgi:hypothetical protein
MVVPVPPKLSIVARIGRFGSQSVEHARSREERRTSGYRGDTRSVLNRSHLATMGAPFCRVELID